MKIGRRQFIKQGALWVPAAMAGLGGILRAGSAPSLKVAGTARVNTISRPAGGGVDSPDDISGLHIWLRASNDSGTNVSCYNDAGSTLCTDGQLCREWHDESGNGFNATHAGASIERPTWHTGVVNSKAVLRGTGTGNNRRLTFGDVMTGLTAAEWFVVLVKVEDPPAAAQDAGFCRWGSHASYAGIPYTDGSVGGGFGTDTLHTVGNPTPSLTSWRLYNEETSSGNYKARLDTTELYSSGTNTVGWDTAPELFADVTAARYMEGDIAEIVVYDNIISASDRAALETYFDNKYALSY